MAQNLRSGFLSLCVFLMLLSACATSPIDKQYRQEAKADNLPFPMALRNPDAHMGDAVIWGGAIIQTTNLKKGSQMIVLETALGDDTRPMDPRYSKGRFIAETPDFLDPELYQKGREITVAGVIAGKKILPVGNTKYTYPVITIKQIHLWEVEQEQPQYRYIYPYGYWGWGPYWGWGGYHGRFRW